MASGWTYGVDGSGEPRSRGNRRVNHARRICKRMAAVLPTALWRIVLVCVVLFGYPAVAPGSAAARLLTVSEYGRDPGSATAVGDALKSQVFCGRLGTDGDARYFAMDLQQGERMRLAVLTPDGSSFAPSLAVMGPGLVPEGSLPAYVEAPPGVGTLVVTGRRTIPDYEPFTPGAYYFTAEIDMEAPASGRYHVAVFDPEHAGAFSLAVGHRGYFSAAEWVLLPYSLLRIDLWAGDGLLLAVGPAVLALLLGLGLVAWRLLVSRRRLGVFQWIAMTAGLLYMGTAARVLAQMIQAATVVGFAGGMAITVAFIVLPLAGGALICRFAWKTDAPTLGVRIGLAALGVAGLGLATGYIAGPVLALIAAGLPNGVAVVGSASSVAAATSAAPTSEPAAENAAEPAAESAPAPVVESPSEPVSEPVPALAAAPAAEPVDPPVRLPDATEVASTAAEGLVSAVSLGPGAAAQNGGSVVGEAAHEAEAH